MQHENLTQAFEDYLKVIYDVTRKNQRASTKSIAERLGIRPASVTGMLQRLATNEPPLVDYRKHQGVMLTAIGERAALGVLRHHRLLELFLNQTLGYSWDEVHDEADRLEHVISEDMEERIANVLGDPNQDPHGHPIPDRELAMPACSDQTLATLRTGDQAIIERIEDEDRELLRYLTELQLVPGCHLTILDHSDMDGTLTLQLDGVAKPVAMGEKLTKRIFVQILQ